MVNEELILNTIKRMKSAGLERETIANTLKRIGLSEQEVQKYIDKEQSLKKSDLNINEDIITATEVAQTAIEQNVKTVENLGARVEKTATEISQAKKAAEISAIETKQLKSEFRKLEENQEDIRAKLNALTKIMKDILEINRKILNKL